MKKVIVFVSFVFLLLLITTPLALLSWISSATHKPISYFPSIIFNSYFHPSLTPGFNFIFLGLDKRQDWLENTSTTDTIIFINFNSDGQATLFSLPRDLWDYSLDSKINHIYPNSLTTNDKYAYIQTKFTQLTGQTITKTVVLTTQNLVDIIKLLGGIDLNLEEGFRDESYPNPEYILHPGPDVPIYITVEFLSGPLHLDETNVTEFVRSRKAVNLSQATDLARIKRQQQLIEALVTKLKTLSPLSYPEIYFFLYNFWGSQIETNFTDQDIAGLIFAFIPKKIQFTLSKVVIPTGEDPANLIYHPLSFPNPQWVYITHQPDFSDLHQFINSRLHVQP